MASSGYFSLITHQASFEMWQLSGSEIFDQAWDLFSPCLHGFCQGSTVQEIHVRPSGDFKRCLTLFDPVMNWPHTQSVILYWQYLDFVANQINLQDFPNLTFLKIHLLFIFFFLLFVKLIPDNRNE